MVLGFGALGLQGLTCRAHLKDEGCLASGYKGAFFPGGFIDSRKGSGGSGSWAS